MPLDGDRKRPSGRTRHPATGPTRPAPDAPTGAVEASVVAQLSAITVAPDKQALAAVALNLARTLDAGAGMAAAAIARELRQTLDALARSDDGADDTVAALFARLSAAAEQ